MSKWATKWKHPKDVHQKSTIWCDKHGIWIHCDGPPSMTLKPNCYTWKIIQREILSRHFPNKIQWIHFHIKKKNKIKTLVKQIRRDTRTTNLLLDTEKKTNENDSRKMKKLNWSRAHPQIAIEYIYLLQLQLQQQQQHMEREREGCYILKVEGNWRRKSNREWMERD